jgi:nucleoid DNA-binding protein
MAVKKKSTSKKKAATRKAPVKKTAARKSAAPKAAAKKAPAVNAKAIADKQTKTQIITTISEETGLNKKEVSAVFASLGNLVQRHMKKRGSGEFTIPETGVKIRRQRKPATKSRKMVSPFTGETITVKAKPARNVVKVTALKALKESVTK